VVRNVTFHGNGTALDYTATTTGQHVIRNDVFTAQTLATVAGCTVGFGSRDYHLLYGNASNGCLAADPNTLTSDPRFVDVGGRDFRLQLGSPAVDTGLNL